jgi:hypothetical protein
MRIVDLQTAWVPEKYSVQWTKNKLAQTIVNFEKKRAYATIECEFTIKTMPIGLASSHGFSHFLRLWVIPGAIQSSL